MNKRKWENPEIPLPVLALKLTEEVAEVGTEITDAHFGNMIRSDKVLMELEHVVFIAGVLRERIVLGP